MNKIKAIIEDVKTINQIRILLAPTAELARTVSANISVEAEYGDECVPGTLYTAAHHGSRSGNPCPCVDQDIPLLGSGTILVSHIDLDTLGGIARALGHRLVRESFWQLAAFVDVNGPHKLGHYYANKVDINSLYAYWVWSQANRGPRHSNDQVHDITSEVHQHLTTLARILDGDETLLAAGKAFKDAEHKLNEDSFVDIVNGCIVRVSPQFTNHLYTTHTGEVRSAVLAFNTKTGAITLSFAEKDDSRNACDIMQEAFGSTAGGHRGIAGSPRGQRMRFGDLNKVLGLLA